MGKCKVHCIYYLMSVAHYHKKDTSGEPHTDFLYCNGFDQCVANNSSVNEVQHTTIEEAVFTVDPTDTPVDWMYSDHMICVYCSSMSGPRLFK